ncbi:TPA: hypothetical protein ACGO7C_002197 [Streptococcus suis]
MRGPNHPMFFWQKDKSWYILHDDYTIELTELAPKEARASFEIYQKEMELRKKGIYA